MDDGCAILESFANQMGFGKKPFKSDRLSVNYEGMLLHAFISCVHSTFSGEGAQKLASTDANWDRIFNSATLGRDRNG